jgi:hypothetical protein
MSRKINLLIIPMILAGAMLGGAISGRLLTATPALAQQAGEPSHGQQWEYCALSKAAYVNAVRESYWIIYFRDTGPQVVDVQSSATDGNGAAMAKAIARLGAEGWEMVGQGTFEARSGAANALYFKRRK